MAYVTEVEVAPVQQMGISAAHALTQSKTLDPRQVFLLLFFVFCLFYLLNISHLSAMRNVFNNYTTSMENQQTRVLINPQPQCLPRFLSRWPGRCGRQRYGGILSQKFCKSLTSWSVSAENLLEMPGLCSILTKQSEHGPDPETWCRGRNLQVM